MKRNRVEESFEDNMLIAQSRKITFPSRPCFTLVELLVSIAIIGVMAGMVLYSLAGAARDAKVQRTRGTIQKLNDIILQRWEEYRYRAAKVNIPPNWLLPMTSGALAGQPLLPPREGARLRMIVLRDIMRMEMPDRFSDLTFPPSRYGALLNGASSAEYTDATGLGRAVPQGYNQLRAYFGYPSLGSTYNNMAMNGSYPFLSASGVSPKPPSYENQEAELLYAIVALTNHNGGAALESFRPSEIADTDGDGYFEFIDAWGQPLKWLRWAAGYESELNVAYREPNPINTSNAADVPAAPDAMDPLRTDWRWSVGYVGVKPWTLVPLIISAGPDGIFDMVFDPADAGGTPLFSYANQTWNSPPAPGAYGGRYFNIDPYFPIPPNTLSNQPSILYVGSSYDEDGDGTLSGWSDNVTNHELILE